MDEPAERAAARLRLLLELLPEGAAFRERHSGELWAAGGIGYTGNDVFRAGLFEPESDYPTREECGEGDAPHSFTVAVRDRLPTLLRDSTIAALLIDEIISLREQLLGADEDDGSVVTMNEQQSCLVVDDHANAVGVIYAKPEDETDTVLNTGASVACILFTALADPQWRPRLFELVKEIGRAEGLLEDDTDDDRVLH